MQEQLDAQTAEMAPTVQTLSETGMTQRDLQRAALGDLAALAKDCAKTEADIERLRQEALEKAAKEFQTTSWAIDERVKKLHETIAQEHRDRLARVELQYQTSLSDLQTSDKAARQRADTEHKATARDLKKDFDQAVWLAESLYDGIQVQIREEAKKAREEYEAQLQWLDSIEKQAAGRVHTYAMEPSQMVDLTHIATPAAQADLKSFSEIREAVERQLSNVSSLSVPSFFAGARPHLALTAVAAAPAGVYLLVQWAGGSVELRTTPMLIMGGIGIVLATALGVSLRILAKSQVRRAYTRFCQAADAARAAAKRQLEDTTRALDARLNEAWQKRLAEEQAARDRFEPMIAEAGRRRYALIQSVAAQLSDQMPKIAAQRQLALQETEEWQQRSLEELRQRRERELQNLQQRYQTQQEATGQKYEESRRALERRLTEGLARSGATINGRAGTDGQAIADWKDSAWRTWVPPRNFPAMVQFGQLRVDLNQIADSVPQHGIRRLTLPEPFSVPAALAFPKQASLLIQTGREGRDQAIRVLQMVMAKLLTSLPPGRARFTIIDPVGLGQNFAGFMHLADHDDGLVGGRIWTDAEHIEQRLADLTEHMETVIQKYLRNEFETIDDYNAQAGELAEPYRFLVIADFPVNFESEAMRRLASIASTGARCGVYTLVVRDTRQPLPPGSHLDELESHSANLVWSDGRFAWKDDVYGQFPLMLDEPPTDEFLTRILDIVGRSAKEAKRVEVAFDTIAPKPQQFWTRSSMEDVSVPIGRMGATRLQSLRLGRGVAQHVLIAGKTGSGKSTLLHALVTNLAMWYHPDEVELYLVDFKKGVEFKTYATEGLPHARAIAVESDREFGLSVLQRIDAELTRRGTMFRNLGVQDLASYRRASGEKMPRTLLIIDEFQEFFSEDDKLAQDASLLLDRLVRQGRAFGIHVLLGSQTIGGTSGLARSTLGQMAVRIALQCSEADSQMILGDNNSAARLLSRPGESIYNDAGGLVEGNSPFQVAWLPDEHRERYLAAVRSRAEQLGLRRAPPIVFEGNAPADIAKNQRLARLLELPAWPPPSFAPVAWLGEPVAIKDPTAIVFRRQSGANLLIVGQQEETAMAIMAAGMASLAAQHAPRSAGFYVLDGTPAGSPLAGVFARMQSLLPHTTHLVEWRAVGDVINALATEMQRRLDDQQTEAPAIYLLVYGLQRYRILRRQEESFGFGSSDEEKKPSTDKQFADLLREGPSLGIHVLVWADTPTSVERTLDRNSLREFDNRVLFQMSASDSSNLIDSPLANKLGFYRALAYSEEQGVMEKFRPYAMPDRAWLEQVGARLAARDRSR